MIVVSVPVGGDALLSVSDEGRAQTISLRTGQRPQLIPLFHPVLGNQARLEDTVHIPAVHKATEAYSYQATVSVALRPWVEGPGWAPAGRAWLVVTFGVRIGPKADLALDLPRSLSLRRGDGAGVPIPAGTVLRVKGTSGSSETWKGTFDVPASLRSVTATFRTNGTVTNPGSGATLSFTRADGDNTRAMKLEPQLEPTR
jgi:hypothetical protein